MAGQNFGTISAPNLSVALYQLSIRAPGGSFGEFATYTFPLSPASVRYDRAGMSSFSDTQGTPAQYGVARVMDRYGSAPPIIMLEGTTGWDRHATDGYVLTGLQSVELLQKFLQRYATLNETQRVAGISQYYSLEFYDYFLGQFWVVEPVGPQTIRNTSDRPLLTYYRFRFAAVQPVKAAIAGQTDALLAVFGTPAQAAAVTAAQTVGAMLTSYSPVGPLTTFASTGAL